MAQKAVLNLGPGGVLVGMADTGHNAGHQHWTEVSTQASAAPHFYCCSLCSTHAARKRSLWELYLPARAHRTADCAAGYV